MTVVCCNLYIFVVHIERECSVHISNLLIPYRNAINRTYNPPNFGSRHLWYLEFSVEFLSCLNLISKRRYLLMLDQNQQYASLLFLLILLEMYYYVSFSRLFLFFYRVLNAHSCCIYYMYTFGIKNSCIIVGMYSVRDSTN